MQKVILTIPLFVLCAYFCDDSHASFARITDENFREKVSVWENDNYHFYRPEASTMWSFCAKEGGISCRLKKYNPLSSLDIKDYQISFESALPIKKEWMDTVINELLNQEGLSYFTVYRVQSFIYNLENRENGIKQNYKNCNNEPNKADNCVHSMWASLLAYNDPNALRNGVIYDAGYQDGELFMFYKIYTSNGLQKYEDTSSLLIEDYTDQAWEVAQKVKPYKRNSNKVYDIELYSKSILATDNSSVDFSKEFDRCKKDLTDKNNGRFSKYNECYCNCVQETININVKQFTTPKKLATNIIDVSYSTCDLLNSKAIDYYTQQLEELLSKNKLSKYDECRYDAFFKYATHPLGKGSVNMCNIGDVISNINKCSHWIFK